MELIDLGCQVCLTKYSRVFNLKNHMYSTDHRQKMADIFSKETFKTCGFFPQISLINPQARRHIKQPIVGLSLMTLCFSVDTETYFYLCHVCEEKRPADRIVTHLSSIDHFRNYFSYVNPNVLRFSWIPFMDKNVTLTPEVLKEIRVRGLGKLQVLDLPENLLKKLEPETYSGVMRTLSENDKLLKLFEAGKPKRTMIQTYQRDSKRKHPLLGMQHLVECICAGSTEKRYYLCTLCHLTLATHMIIKHILSFDHIYCYFKEWHPSTLLSKGSYQKYNYRFASTMLDFAKQAELQSTGNTDMKQVSLEPAKYTSVNFASYAEALKELESIRKENKEDSLITVIKPGSRLQPHTASAAPVVRAGPAASSAPAGPTAASAAAAARGTSVALAGPTAPAVSVSSAAPAGQANSAVSSASEGPTAAPAAPPAPVVPAGPGALSYKLHCQNCSMSFDSMHKYCNHLSKWNHKQMLKRHFGGVDDCKAGWKPSLDLYMYHQERLKHNEPLIGVSLVVTCVSNGDMEDPFYVCFACEDCFCKSFRKQHFNSMKHLINTLLHQNPWRLPFAWENLDVEVLRSMAWEEEKERGPKQMLLKVLDMPSWEFKRLDGLSYPNVMARLQQYHTILRRDVPPSERHSKLQQNERFPLLGANFVVMFHVCVKGVQLKNMGFLCLLCERRLSGAERYAHVFSREHVVKFLKCFHRVFNNSSTSAETLLDLAIQAGWSHLLSDVQIVQLDKPIWEPCSYEKAIKILKSVKKKEGKTELIPPICLKEKLVPRETSEKDKDHVRDNSEKHSRTMEGCEKTLSQNSDSDETTLKKMSVEVGADVSSAHCVQSGENTEKGDNKETPTPSDEESKRGDVTSKTSSEEIQNAGRETCQGIKEEKIKEPTSRKPTDGSDGTEAGIQTSRSITQKRKFSQEGTCPAMNVTQDMDHKRQRFTSKEDTPHKEPQNLPGNAQNVSEPVAVTASASMNQQPGEKLWQYLSKKSRDPVVGLSALLECNNDERDPLYLCECCSLKIPEKDIISHVTGVYHQRMYLVVLQKLSPGMHQRDSVRRLAEFFEQENGYGEAEAVDLDDKTFNKISQQDFKSAIQTVKALKNQQDSEHDLPSTSASPGVQPTYQDNYQVVNMEIDDDPEDSKAQPSSETTSDETRVPRESNKDVSVTHIKVSASAENVNTNMTVCRGSENKVKIISNTAVGLLKTATTSKTVGTSQTAAALDSTVTTTSMTAISKFTDKSSNSTPDTTKSMAPCSRHTAATSSCTTANTKLREPGYKSTASSIPSMSKPLENRTGAAAKVPATSHKTATAPKSESTVVREAACRTASKSENASKNSENASKTAVASQTMGTSVATAKMSKTLVACENTAASVKTAPMKNSVSSASDVAPNAAKSKTPAAPHLTARSENKNPHTDPSHTKTSQSLPRIGLNQLIAVTCQGRRQVYCQLCSVRLQQSSHMCEFIHVLGYLNMRYPGWIAKSYGQIVEKANHLAEVEKDIRSHDIKRLEVKIDEYKELARLSEDEAIEKLKEKLIQRDMDLSSPSSTDTAEPWRQQVPSSSPWEISSPDDEIESTSEKRETPAVGQSHRAQSMKSSEPEADHLISDQPHSSSIVNKNEPIADPSTEDTGIAVKVDKPQGHDVRHLATDSADRSAQTPNACQETPEKRKRQERSDPRLQGGRWKASEGSQKTSSVKFLNPDPPSPVAAVTTERQNHPKPRQKSAEHVSEHSQELPVIIIGQSIEGSSNLFKHYLMMKGYDPDTVIGLSSVWECQGVSLSPFYLCESCAETLSISDICSHVVSKKHQENYMWRLKPQFLSFMEYDLPEEHKEKIFNGVAERVAQQERYNEIDAQVIMLRPELYKMVQNAPFSEALMMVQKIYKAKKLSVPWQVICTSEQKDQEPEAQQSPEESLPMETQTEPPPETDQRGGARQKTEKPRLEEMVGNLDKLKQRRALSPPHVTSVSSTTDSVTSSILGADTCLSPQDQPEPRTQFPQHQSLMPELEVNQAEVHSESLSDSVISPQTSQILSESPRDKCRPARKRKADESVETPMRSCTSNPQLEEPIPAKQTCNVLQPVSQPSPESDTESTSVNRAAVSTLMSLKDGDAEQDTPVMDMTKFAEDPFPAKQTCRLLQPVSQPSPESATEPTSVNPAATSTLMSLKDGDTEQDTSFMDMTKFDELIALVRKMKSEVHASPRTLAPNNGNTNTSCASNSSESGVERVWNPNSVQTTVVQKTTRWDLKWELVKVTNNPPPSNVSEEMFSTAAPVVLGHENQLVTPNASSVYSASSSSPEASTSTRGNLLFRATEAKAFSTMSPSASTVDPTDPQQQRSDSAHSIFGNQSDPIPIHCTVTNDNPSQISQPLYYTETDGTGVPQLPINTIVTVRPKPPEQQFVVDYNGQDNTEVKRGNQATHSLSTVSPGDPSGGYGQYSQMACVTTGQSGYLSFEAVRSNPTPNNPPVYAWSSYQYEGQTTRGLYSSQIHPQQEASHSSLQSFGQSGATPQVPEWARLGMQQRGLLLQGQYSTWPSASMSAEVGSVTNEAACVGTSPFMIPPNGSQMIDLNQYSTSGFAPTLNSNNLVTQNTPGVIYHLPAANTEMMPQPSANPFFAPGT
ncbi:uncharacterized protein LOC126383582 isoform X2 [Epinephelus moara]|uniref:uncharacterized protein LOC126383582 isoform X2 n=1 Tax=Epinephelus moara TaxID=300413 RepID=UPI00214F023C|nr:uncharacterized protein LOC126383582 isoform X2 [Epinephelus moara]